MSKINVQNIEIGYQVVDDQDYICLTDMAKQKDGRIEIIIQNWMRNRMTIEFLGLWEKINNPKFNHIEFDVFRSKAGLNSFYLTPTQWMEKTNAIGIITKKGRYGGTYAHRDIAFEFASWLSPEFKLYLIKEFDRLKNEEQKQLGWDIKRNLAKINYRIHTDAIKKNLIPEKLNSKQINIVYANEADVLNMALFGMTAKQWRDNNPDKEGNISIDEIGKSNGRGAYICKNIECLEKAIKSKKLERSLKTKIDLQIYESLRGVMIGK